MPAIEPAPDVEAFFGEQVAVAMRDLRLEAAPQTQDYLVCLLSGFAVSERIQSLTEPLVALLQRALDARGADRLARMRELGDAALFVCGFFPESFERRGVDPSYAATMGGRAYHAAGTADRDRSRGRVLVELARRFAEFARVLDEVRERTAVASDGDIVQLYDRWVRSGSPAVARRLGRRGVHPARGARLGPLH